MIFETVIIDQILPLFSTPCFCAELSSGTTHSSVCCNSLRVQRDVNFLLLTQLLLTKIILTQYPTPCFCTELSSGTTHGSVRCNRLRVHIGVNFLLLRHLLFFKSFPDLPPTAFTHNPHLYPLK